MAASPLEPRANPELIGHGRALSILGEAWRSGRLPHAWLLHGPRGVGKATLAFRAARALLAGAADTDATLALAEDHPVFRQVASGAHPDLRVLEPPRDAGARSRSEIPVDAVRSVTTALHGTAAMGGYKVVVVDGAERLNRNAASALLKPLEEPPPRTILLLVGHRPSRILPTIRSRCAKLRLAPLDDDQVTRVLVRRAPELGEDERAALARLGRGSPGRALDLAASGSLDLYRRLTDALAAAEPDPLTLHDLAGDLARHADQHGGMAAPLGLIQELLGRTVAAGLARREEPIFGGETDALDRLAARRPLDRWSRLWEKTARLSARADGVNLDRFHVLLHILTTMAPASGQADEGPPDGAPLGGPHALG